MSDDVMVDSSAWIDFFRHGQNAVAEAVDQLLDQERIVLCGMVELELLQGARPRQRRLLADVFKALRYVDSERRDFVATGDRLAELRRKGVTIPASDGLIGMLCVRHNLRLLSTDSHFDHLPEVRRLTV